MIEPLVKFGHIVSGEELDFTYPDIWVQEKTTGPDRLAIAPRHKQAELLIDLMSTMNGPFGILYVLVVPRGGGMAGRYQCPEPLNADDVQSFLNRFRRFLEEDGRHSLWIASVNSSSLLVYDRHNVIYAYGDLERFKQVLLRHSLEERVSLNLPDPHIHRYHAAYDELEDEILSSCDWIFSELRDSDEISCSAL
jgi:hypothetical protein